MLVACAESLRSAGTVEPKSLLEALAEHYEPARGFGHGMKIALTAFRSGTPWHRCAFVAWPEGSRGNGGAVRIPPVALVRWPDSASFDAAVRLATRVTHGHKEAIAFARVHAVAVATVLADPAVVNTPRDFYGAMIERLDPAPELVVAKFNTLCDLADRNATRTEAGGVLGTSTLACESVPAALWSFVSQHKTFTESVCSAALLGGDVDSICCLVGSLAGALHGSAAIEESWIRNLSHERPSPAEVLALADALTALVPLPLATAG